MHQQSMRTRAYKGKSAQPIGRLLGGDMRQHGLHKRGCSSPDRHQCSVADKKYVLFRRVQIGRMLRPCAAQGRRLT